MENLLNIWKKEIISASLDRNIAVVTECSEAPAEKLDSRTHGASQQDILPDPDTYSSGQSTDATSLGIFFILTALGLPAAEKCAGGINFEIL